MSASSLPRPHSGADGGLFGLVSALREATTRPAAAAALAQFLGAEDLLIFIPDRELHVLLPAPGFAQTLPGRAGWRAFLVACGAESPHIGPVRFPGTPTDSTAVGFTADDGSVVVLRGTVADQDGAADLTRLLPILVAAFEGERVAAVAEANITLAKQTATQAKLLADSLDRARNELRQTLAEARRANAAKDRFLAVLSHELRTPLNPVLMAASAMETDPNLPAEIRGDIAMIRRNVELEAKLIDDLLDLTRIANGKVQLHQKIVDAHDLLEEAVTVVRGDHSAPHPTFALALSAPSHFVHGDPARLLQIFWNLIRNAVKFTAGDGRVSIQSSNEGEKTLRIEVLDTGMGIAPELLPKIFNAFEQGDPEINRTFGGLGLGLAISKALAEMHGGTLRAESDGLGEGARFIFELPVAVGEAPGASIWHGLPAERDCREILLVEDHATTAALMARLLRRRGHRVEIAGTVTEAVRVGLQRAFDIVISDLGLPDGTGYEVMEALRRLPGLTGIALSGYGMDADLARSAEAGFHFHLTKPVDAQKLYATIERIGSTTR